MISASYDFPSHLPSPSITPSIPSSVLLLPFHGVESPGIHRFNSRRLHWEALCITHHKSSYNLAWWSILACLSLRSTRFPGGNDLPPQHCIHSGLTWSNHFAAGSGSWQVESDRSDSLDMNSYRAGYCSMRISV